MDVYLDAVFNPRCIRDPFVFAQEGWHHELDAPDGEMTFKGVVFNEMKGVYSQPDSIHYEDIQRCLFPDNNYAVNSGGDPEAIPDLTFEQFKAFHAKFYHPSNARCGGAGGCGLSGLGGRSRGELTILRGWLTLASSARVFLTATPFRFWLYGDDPVEERLRRIAAYLDNYDARTDFTSLVPMQPLFSEPRRFVGHYAAGQEVRAGGLRGVEVGQRRQ